MMEFPLYKLTIDDSDETGVDYIALVDLPAIERNFLTFSKQQAAKFQISNKEKRVVSGALMIANLPIYRNDKNFGEHYVVFDKEAIEKIVYKFFKNKFSSNVNLMHLDNQKVDGVYMFESLIIDSRRGIKPPEGFGHLTDGSWFGSFKVENDQVWNDFLKTGIFKGFSVEGIFKYDKKTSLEELKINRIIEVINSVTE